MNLREEKSVADFTQNWDARARRAKRETCKKFILISLPEQSRENKNMQIIEMMQIIE